MLSNEGVDVICIRYRAQNGFGSINRDILTVTSTGATSSSSAYRKHCTHQSLYDLTGTLPTLMKIMGR